MLYVKFITGCLATALLLGGCTKETEQKGADPVTPDADNSRRKVLMTLKNKLSVKPVTSKAGTPIATAAENAISTLDVYVFGATQESGDYTFQERFAYRADPKDKLPKGATELQLNTTGADGKETEVQEDNQAEAGERGKRFGQSGKEAPGEHGEKGNDDHHEIA